MKTGDAGYRGPGGRPRGKLAAKAARAARLASMERDPEAATIARNVYGIAVEIRGRGGQVPLAIEAPLVAAAEQAALAICLRDKIEPTDENVNNAAAYLVTVFRQAVISASPSTLALFRAGVTAAGQSG